MVGDPFNVKHIFDPNFLCPYAYLMNKNMGILKLNLSENSNFCQSSSQQR